MELFPQPVQPSIAIWALVMALGLFFVGELLIDAIVRGNDARAKQTNEAYAAKRHGLVMGPAIAMLLASVFVGLNSRSDLLAIAVAYAIALFWGVAGHWLYSWAFLGQRAGGFVDRCLPTGYSRKAFAMGMGVITGACFMGEAPSIETGIASLALFSSLGAAGIVLGLWLVSALVYVHPINPKLVRPEDDRSDLRHSLRTRISKHSNPASGPIAVGVILLIAFMEAAAMAGDFTNWGDAFQGYFTALGLALVLATGSIFVVDLVILRHINLWQVLHHSSVAPAKTLRTWMLVIGGFSSVIINQLVP